jgi:hypothetical protein
MLQLSEQFRLGTQVIYPPFKKGLYLEEAFYKYYCEHIDEFEKTEYIYIPAFWTNLQIDDHFQAMKPRLQAELDIAIAKYPTAQKYFTVVQHDDAVLLNLPPSTLIFGACSGHIPIPLIYEDTTHRLAKEEPVDYKHKTFHVSFVGSPTHPVRNELLKYGQTRPDWTLFTKGWTNQVHPNHADFFIDTTKKSKFVLAPRGYGRSSFRFFECFLLKSIPIYVYDDIEWLPYKEILDYTQFCISISRQQTPALPTILQSIDESTYNTMLQNYQNISHYFTLEGMSKYILHKLSMVNTLPPFYKGQN